MADNVLALHATRLTALEGRVSADSLAQLFCPAFSITGPSAACYPAPGTTVMVAVSEGVTFSASAGALWSVEDFTDGATSYYVTGSGSGTDIQLPPGTWVFSWHLEGTPDSDGYYAFYRLGTDGASQRVSCTGPDGSITVTADAMTGLSVWLYNSGSGWASTGYPVLKAMLADTTLQDTGFRAPGTVTRAANSFISPDSHAPVYVWTEDGSTLTASGYLDLPHALGL